NANKLPVAPATDAVTNAAPVTTVTVIDTSASAPGRDQKAGAKDANSSPDLSGLTREQLEARVKTLTENLASANTESEYFREQWTELKLRDEALGVEALTGDEGKTQDKLVQAVAELYRSEMKRREALVLLDKLVSTSGKMLQTAPNYDPKLRADYEVASRAAREYLGGHNGAAIPLAASLTDGQISDINPQLNAIIINVGKTQGVKEGMPFLLFQGDVEVGTAKVVLARDLVSAALVENLKPNTVLKVGDRASVYAQQ
ncbi:MAG: rod shape-determining protein MreC, partial [Methylacidiphilales bacterium]|nr:rod shape-determining protein MreC [Candidatus Methylacidiphilales bacterium]